jgi:hypothetical protein
VRVDEVSEDATDGMGEVYGGWDWWGGCWQRGTIAFAAGSSRTALATALGWTPARHLGAGGTDHAVT